MFKNDSPRPREASGRISIGGIAVVLWVLLAAALGYRWFIQDKGTAASNSAAVNHSDVPSLRAQDALAAMVAAKTAEFHLAAKAVTTPEDRALEASSAIKKGEFAKARTIAEDVLSQSRVEGWGFYPFNAFTSAFVRGNDPNLLSGLNQWVKQYPHSALPYLMRSLYFRNDASEERGGSSDWMVPESLLNRFREDVAQAAADAQQAMLIEPNNPWSFYDFLAASTRDSKAEDVQRVFEAGIKAFPNYYPLYKEKLRLLQQQSHGSADALYDFVDQYAGRAHKNSPLKLLYLDLYVHLLQRAAHECPALGGESRERCYKRYFEPQGHSELEAGMASALKLYEVSDPNQFSIAVWPLLASMSCDKCLGLPSAGAGVLQIAASIMGSDNQMMDKPTHNSYMLDDITARVWAQSGNPSNANQKFLEALSDVEHTTFRDPAQKAQVQAEIFDHMAAVADDNSQFIDIIVDEDAANLVGGANHGNTPYRKCYAYYRLKHLKEAESECKALIEGNGNYMQSHYWLAKAYEGLQEWDASIAEFTPAADSANNWFRVGAALDMSYDYGQKGDFAGQLDSMDRYPYLFDSRMQPAHDLAVAYNNRCFALMKLGRLQDALNDCTKSLRYDRIPDALHKQQELLKLLGKKESV
jgi:hypothetical protein